jgi:ferrochelatase
MAPSGGAPQTDAILLVNLGTPEAPTPESVRAYLAEFLSDPRVVDYPRAVWLPLLHGVILNLRPRKTAKAYASIWRNDTNESPLRYFTRRQAERLAQKTGIPVAWAMRYGAPGIRTALADLASKGVGRVTALPLYPQFSRTTTSSVEDALNAALAGVQDAPRLRFIPEFHADPRYIAALTATTRRHLAALAFKPQRVVLSFHGIPERFVRAGDPYAEQVRTTAARLRFAMSWSADFAPLAFQSRFGPEKWLGPSTAKTIERAAASGMTDIAVAAPGFASDCLETLEELGIGLRERFLKAGGKNFAILPCLNDSDEAIDMLAHIAAGPA